MARLRVSSDPKPREGTETRNPAPHPQLRHAPEVVRPKTPRGDGNPTMASKSAWVTDPGRQTQNPERGRKREEPSHLGLPPAGRQTQNPERGRKHFERELVHSPPFRSSDPKPREGTETLMVGHGRARLSGSSDPKPREGTETSTPSVPHTGPVPCRQTQNPERGRKPDGTELSGFYQVVVRPKTPRGDGNPHGGTWTSATIGVVGPKTPRGDGNWTQNRTGCGRCSSRQTQNPERGRKHTADDSYVRVTSSQSSDPKPREGTET
ncbi:Uncharacterised protein [Mycobacterium tuberculosis]|nr:Uncharacterised protein [Mycobacterium tuberculosis]